MELVVTKVAEGEYFTYKRIGHIPEQPTNGNLIWHLNCLGWWRGEYDIDGKRRYYHHGYEEYDGFVISAPTELDAIRIACEKIGDSLDEHIHWTIELVGAALHNLDRPIIMRSNTGA